jgi:hypothetical protein
MIARFLLIAECFCNQRAEEDKSGLEAGQVIEGVERSYLLKAFCILRAIYAPRQNEQVGKGAS